MEETGKKSSKSKKVVAFDGDKLGMIGGTIGAILVLLISLYAHPGDMMTTIIRMGTAFVICYGGTFFLVRVILRATLQEMIEQEKKDKAARKEARDADKQARREERLGQEIQPDQPQETE